MSLGGRKIPVGCSIDKSKEQAESGVEPEKKLVDNIFVQGFMILANSYFDVLR